MQINDLSFICDMEMLNLKEQMEMVKSKTHSARKCVFVGSVDSKTIWQRHL